MVAHRRHQDETAAAGLRVGGRFRLVVSAVVALGLVPAVAAIVGGCGDEEKKATVVPVAATPSASTSAPTRYVAEPWGFSFLYDPARFIPSSVETVSQIDLARSLLTDEPLGVTGLETLEVNLDAAAHAGAEAGASFSLTVVRLPFSVGSGEGLARLMLDDLLTEAEARWGGVLSDGPHMVDLPGAASAFAAELVGDGGGTGGTSRLRGTVATDGRRLYVARETFPDAAQSDARPPAQAVTDSIRLDEDAGVADLTAGEMDYVNEDYGFSLVLPPGFPLILSEADPGPQLEFGVEFVDVARSPLVAVAVGVAAAPAAVGNSQSRVLQTYYRKAAERLRDEPSVVSVEDPRAIKMNGSTAWLIDVTERLPDGTEVQTRTYDVWHDDFVYSVVTRGRASAGDEDRQVLDDIVDSFRVL